VRLTLAATEPEIEATPGWFNHGDRILALVEQQKPRVCVELGSWMGASAIPVARAIRRWSGALTCVDTWSGTVGHAGGAPMMVWSFARNVFEAGVAGNVRMIAAPSVEAARWWREPIDYLYVDADHSYEAVIADLHAWVPHVRPGGLIVGDDYGHRNLPGVAPAWDEFCAQHGIRLERHQSVPPHPDRIEVVYATVEESCLISLKKKRSQ